MSITVTATEAVRQLREAGMHMTVARLVDGIESGSYPFGRIVRAGPTGRRTVEIFRKDLQAWLEQMRM